MTWQKRVSSINPLFFVVIVLIAIFWLYLSSKGELDNNWKSILALALIITIVLMLLFSERKLLTIEEAKQLAFEEAMKMQNRGEIREDGRLILLEDGKLMEVEDQQQGKRPEAVLVGVGVSGDEPMVIAFSFHPYTAYIKMIRKRTHWNAGIDPDLKIVVPPTWTEWLEAERLKREAGF